MIYGANGYTGELIAREAVRRGHRPLLAGRSAEKVEPLARELGCEWRAFPLEAPRLDGVSLVLHCAGPFVHTALPMVRACLAGGAHYLDITGEIAVFESIFALDDEARRAGVTLLPGVGFDVVPTDCLAAMLAERLPNADELWLAFYAAGSSLSRGTMKTMIEGLHEGGAIRENGRIKRVPMAYDVRQIPFSCGPRMAMTIPWGDVATAWRTTGIPNIRVYNAASPRAIAQVRRVARILPLLRFRPLRRLLQRVAGRRTGPPEAARAAGRTYLWGRAARRDGAEATMTMETPEGYAFTVLSAVRAVERVLAGGIAAGSLTPAAALGAGFVREVEGVVVGDTVVTS
jgi:saccharopine dehydrogenase (NAD+, L-lysine-forming)